MAIVAQAVPTLSGDLTLFHTTDPLLSNSPVLIFHGPASTIGATSSRIQVHIFTPAGIGSYTRLAVSPTSPFYSAVSNLPREEQGDEACRGLAFGLKKYFEELPESVKKTWCAQVKAPSPAALFGNDHIAIIASRMTRIDNVEEVIAELGQAFGEQRQSWMDVDVVLPSGSIKDAAPRTESLLPDEIGEAAIMSHRYGKYADLIASFGDITFLPTSKLKRAPSKASAIGRSASFLRRQKENVRKELSELVGTEASYVERVKELYETSISVGADLKPMSRQQLQQVFPRVIKELLEVNTGFLDALRTIFDATEASSVQDIESSSETDSTTQQTRQDIAADSQGVCAIAKCLCQWLPQFAECYTTYMSDQSKSAKLLRTLLRSSDSALTGQLQSIGEQKLTSLLIEPVQRLPRYTLYIDSITKQLPVRHPALKNLLKARDIISDICAQDDAENEFARVEERLRSRVSDWPVDLTVGGRLITVVDCVALEPPFDLRVSAGPSLLLIVFGDRLVLLEKLSTASTSAKGFLSDIDFGVSARDSNTTTGPSQDLRFWREIRIDRIVAVESHDGCALRLFYPTEHSPSGIKSQSSMRLTCQMLRLDSSYDSKAARLVEELSKASIEYRFSETEREGSKWEVRAAFPGADHSGLLSAVFDDSDAAMVSARNSLATTRIVIDLDRHSQRPRAGQQGLRNVIAVSPLQDGHWRVTIDSIDGSLAREQVAATDLATMLAKRLSLLSFARFALEQPTLTPCYLTQNTDILQAVTLRPVSSGSTDPQPSASLTAEERFKRPKSPRKLLSTFLSSTGPGHLPPSLRKDLPALPPPTQLPRLPMAAPPTSKPPSRDSRPTSQEQATPRSISSMRSTDQFANSHKKLEETLNTYVLALQARKGNIVGRSLKMRATADELAVNELYNSVLEDPNMMVLAAQASVDVLFAAFEKFLNAAWREHAGQIMPLSLLQEIQHKAETLFPTDFDAFFRSALSSLSPQNQRAFKGIMKLLADLLDGTGNDGDRGILTAAFAEVLVTEGNPHDFIALIDRFVDDSDTYFGEPLEEVHKPVDGHGSMHKRARSVNSASLTSNTSSLRKKFGFSTLTRENSKSEAESKVASVWRTLSKTARGDPPNAATSTSRGTLQRSHSTDIDGRLARRPSSQDGPLKPSYGDQMPDLSGPASALSLGLSTIGEHPSFLPTGPPRKKRRSSLSDLKVLEVSQAKSPILTPSAARRSQLSPPKPIEDKSLPNSPVPSTPSSKGGSGRFGSPVRETPRSRLPASFRKEDSPSTNKVFDMPEPLRPRASSKPLDEVVITPKPSSAIPTLAPRLPVPKTISPISLRTGLTERRDAGNMIRRPSSPSDKTVRSTPSKVAEPAASPKKLRMQSPQKIRERLQNEQTALSAAQTSLQDELSKIGDELTSTPSRIGSVRGAPRSHLTPSHLTPGTPSSLTRHQPSSTMDLAQRVLKMEGQLVKHIDDINARINSVQGDLASSLTVSENKCKKLDALYRECNGENEALYARFNDELSRILKAVRGGEGVEMLKAKMKESEEEVAKLKRENMRLKRENVGLRAQMRD